MRMKIKIVKGENGTEIEDQVEDGTEIEKNENWIESTAEKTMKAGLISQSVK